MKLIHQFWIRLINLGFHLLYHQLAWTYDAVSWLVSLGSWRAWQKAALPYVRGLTVLEIAHGPGHMLVELAKREFQVIGLDYSLQMIRLARQRLERHDLRVPVLRSKAENLPFPAAHFDVVLATFPTEFIVKERTLAAVWRTLKPGGQLIIVPQAELSGRDPLARIIEWLYAITGQRGHVDRQQPSPFVSKFQARFAGTGFELNQEVVDLGRSRVFILIAKKINPPH